MTMSDTAGTLAAHMRGAIEESLMRDGENDALEDRVVAIEEVLAARWPRRLLVAWRLGRKLRQSAAPFREAGPAFADRRCAAISAEDRGPACLTPGWKPREDRLTP